MDRKRRDARAVRVMPACALSHPAQPTRDHALRVSSGRTSIVPDNRAAIQSATTSALSELIVDEL
jgi:hypothetical protein